MKPPKSYAILTQNNSNTKNLVESLLKQENVSNIEELQKLKGLLFSRSEINRFMDEEERHDIKILTRDTNQPLKTMSSGEQKKALLNYLLQQEPDFLILVNPFDNLDVATQAKLKDQLNDIASSRILVQLVSRVDDILPSSTDFFKLDGDTLQRYESPKDFWQANQPKRVLFEGTIPPPLSPIKVTEKTLVQLKKVSVSFDGRQVLNQIDWKIESGEFWQLIGPNGSGKSTILSMITGDSHKGYGQDLTIFGQKKGSGESVWDLKQKIGYYTPAITNKFRGYHTLEHMVISGLHDSIGLYVQPTDAEKQLAKQWLALLKLDHKKEDYFKDLSVGEKRLVMMARAMVKHSPLLILDEPTAGLDDASASLFVALVNKIAQESDSAIVFVSHRKEPQLEPERIFELQPDPNGSLGIELKP
ncbi:ATP-binding cassette domain-containing protein [Flagellimonas zhangzhouensis]|uniref:Molybdate transport system ATP-binding protein n=1 Tax=Flagellimonas zhangzhouensis TaxID=1073328 RepID=A0A1H2QH52_9FLAO|nr:ATP-binding cassette domain-containing protein [Allomuricauda zhangzhouensis]SDQ53138.1 molybdate transport system ATP-binding protein [Allomuricauda zhangzhouensis]SDW06501.1 molybdate transport system ATP-binding protein [Allomuricauda zhangzhouensis]